MTSDHKSQTRSTAAEVGYGRPPKSSQFKPGQSGNPSGRPKKKAATTLQAAVSQLMQETVSVKINGRVRKMTRAEVLAAKVFADATAGDGKALQQLTHLAKHSPEPDRGAEWIGAAERLRKKFEIIMQRRRERAADGGGTEEK